MVSGSNYSTCTNRVHSRRANALMTVYQPAYRIRAEFPAIMLIFNLTKLLTLTKDFFNPVRNVEKTTKQSLLNFDFEISAFIGDTALIASKNKSYNLIE
jgi:hypothetical protein